MSCAASSVVKRGIFKHAHNSILRPDVDLIRTQREFFLAEIPADTMIYPIMRRQNAVST